MILSICAQFCSHTACSLLVILQVALQKQSFFYAIFNSQNNIGSMRRYPELKANDSVIQNVKYTKIMELFDIILRRNPLWYAVVLLECCSMWQAVKKSSH